MDEKSLVPENKSSTRVKERIEVAKKLTKISLDEFFGDDSYIPDALMSMGYCCPRVFDKLFRPRSMGTYVPLSPVDLYHKDQLANSGVDLKSDEKAENNGHSVHIETLASELGEEVKRDETDLVILKDALTVYQKYQT